MSACRADEPLVPLRRNPRGRPRLSEHGLQEVTLRLPVDVFDMCCREAHARSVTLSVVFREAIIHSRVRRGDILR